MKEDIVVVSDLHFDFWSKEAGRDRQGQTKRLMWADFIESIRDTTRLLVINGDPLDIPGAAGTALEPDQTALLLPLKKLIQSGTEILYVIGNHDIGVAGIRIEPGPAGPPGSPGSPGAAGLPNVFPGMTVRYPRSLVEAGGKTYFLEHGDYLEPLRADTALALAKFAWRLLFRRDVPRDLVRLSARVRQRRRPFETGVPTRQMPGVINRPRSLLDWLYRRYPEQIWELQRQNWRRAASEKLRSVQQTEGITLSGIIFGHTHLPDETEIDAGGARAVYVNSGSWSSDVPCATYLVIGPDGVLKRRCFWDKKRGQDLNNETCNLKACLGGAHRGLRAKPVATGPSRELSRELSPMPSREPALEQAPESATEPAPEPSPELDASDVGM